MDTLRSFRFVDGTAYFDYDATIIACFVITYFTKIPVTLVTIVLLLLSIPFHYYFGISTPTNRYLNLKP